jgi:hypothetical protein
VGVRFVAEAIDTPALATASLDDLLKRARDNRLASSLLKQGYGAPDRFTFS